MIQQILNLQKAYSLTGGGVVTLNNKNEIILKKPSEVTETDKQVCKRIRERVIEEGAHPSILRMFEQLSYDANEHSGLYGSDLITLKERILWWREGIEKKTYVEDLARHANRWDNSTMLRERLGIDSSKDYDSKSEKYLGILKLLEDQGVDLLDTGEAMRYINAIILERYEINLLNSIAWDDKYNPDLLLKKLKEIQVAKQYNHYVVDKLIAQAEVWKVMKDNNKLAGFPFKDIWRFCIAIEFQKYGAYICENEPGYIVAILRALGFSLGLKKPTYLDYIEINKRCGEAIYKGLFHPDYQPIGLRDGTDASYGIRPDEMDEQGFKDLEERGNRDNFVHFCTDRDRVYIRPVFKLQGICRMQFLFEQHDKKIVMAKNKAECLMPHLWLPRELVINQHFRDANGRSSHLLLMSLLANDRELPMMLYNTDANLMDVTGPLAFVKRYLSGVKNFNSFCGVDEVPLSFKEIDRDIHISEKCRWSDYHPSDVELKKFEWRIWISQFTLPVLIFILGLLIYKLSY